MNRFPLFFSLILILALHARSEKTISVLYFENIKADPEYAWLHKGLADMLITDLTGTEGVIVIERESLEKILNEQALALSGLMEDKPAIRVGQLLQAEILIYGTYIINDNQIRIDVRLAEVASGKIIHTCLVQGDPDDLFELEEELVGQIKSRLKLGDKQIVLPVQTKSLAALARFYTGLDYMDRHLYDAARTEFLRAKELDPLYYRAQESLAESFKFLKAFKEYRQQREIADLYMKINRLQNRLGAADWITFADIVQSPRYQSMSIEEQQTFNTSHNEYLICNTRAQCTWHIMLTLDEIARKTVTYDADTASQQKLWQKIVEIADESKALYRADPFLSEILYFQLVALYSLNDYQTLKEYAEAFLISYPSYRMVETVEDYYQKALDVLSEHAAGER